MNTNKPRKIVQIVCNTTVVAHEGVECDSNNFFVALCDDGTVWTQWNGNMWEQLPSIPQDKP